MVVHKRPRAGTKALYHIQKGHIRYSSWLVPASYPVYNLSLYPVDQSKFPITLCGFWLLRQPDPCFENSWSASCSSVRGDKRQSIFCAYLLCCRNSPEPTYWRCSAISANPGRLADCILCIFSDALCGWKKEPRYPAGTIAHCLFIPVYCRLLRWALFQHACHPSRPYGSAVLPAILGL